MKAVLILVVTAVISSRSHVDACDEVAFAICHLPSISSFNICNLLREYKTCAKDSSCFSGSVETAFNAILLISTCDISSRSCDAEAFASCRFPTPGSANICNSLAEYKTCAKDASCFSGATESAFNTLLLISTCDISSRSCDAEALASCRLPTSGSANICNSLAEYKTCAKDASCFSGATESAFNTLLKAAKCGACNAKISLSVMSLTAALFFFKKLM